MVLLMKKLLVALFIVLVVFTIIMINSSNLFNPLLVCSENKQELIRYFFDNRLSGEEVCGQGKVLYTLSDDKKGTPHQKFIVKLPSGHKLLIVHNLAIASRIKHLQEGEYIEFKGEYEWNSKGGLVHWTHRDPNGNHEEGWIKYDGKIYQ